MRAMILAAGRGERMRPLTDTTPKPLLEAGGKPLIVWQIQRLVAAGFIDIIINHAWLGAQIEQTLGDGSQYGARLRYSPETTKLETAGGIAQALPFFQQAPFLVVNGDVWCDWDPVHAHHHANTLQRTGALAWLLLTENPVHNPEGDFILEAGTGGHDPLQATPLRIKPSCTPGDMSGACAPPQAHAMTFTGVGVYQPELFAQVPPGQCVALGGVLQTAMESGRVIGSCHAGQWTDVGTPQRLQELSQRLVSRPQARYTLV